MQSKIKSASANVCRHPSPIVGRVASKSDRSSQGVRDRIAPLESAPAHRQDPATRAAIETQLEQIQQVLERDLLRGQSDRFQPQQDLAWMALQSMSDGAIVVDRNGCIDYLNRAAETLLGWALDDVSQRPIGDIFLPLDAPSRQPLHGFIDRVLTEERGCMLPQLAVVQTREGLDRAIDASASPLRTEAGRTVGAIVVFRDISALQQQAQQLWHQAHHDALTGLVNRRGFVNRLQATLDATVRAEDRHVLCYLDLDGFKRVNDTCGHAAGDELLRQISQLVQQRVRATDTLARLGGDEFCVLLYGCSLARASQIAEGWRAAIAAVRFAWAGQTFEIGASIGLFEIDASTPSTDGALKAADKACYRAKRDGRNCVRAYCPTDNRGSERRGDRAWIQRLERALAEDEFVLFGQAMLPLNDDRRQRSEVLLRLQADSGDYCMPMAFIPAAERYGLMPRIDFKIIQTAIACLQESEPTPELLGSDTLAPKTATPNSGRVFSINLSGASLSDRSFWQALADELDRHSGVGASLCFEISEMVAIANLSAAMDFITTFKRFGCEFALDRFSGMSSFSCLQQLAVDFLKLDGSAIAPSTSHPLDRAMLSSSIHISRAMGLQTVVLRAEHAEAIANVKALGADYVQGYGVAHPVLLTDRLGAASQFPRLSA